MAPGVQGPAQQSLSPEHLSSEVLHRTGSPSLCFRELWTCFCYCACLIACRSASSSRLLVLLVFGMAMPRAEPGIRSALKECLYPLPHSLWCHRHTKEEMMQADRQVYRNSSQEDDAQDQRKLWGATFPGVRAETMLAGAWVHDQETTQHGAMLSTLHLSVCPYSSPISLFPFC